MAESADRAPGATDDGRPAAAAAPVAVGMHHRVFPAEPLPTLSSPTATAFAAAVDPGPGPGLFGLALTSVVPRITVLRTLVAEPAAGVLHVAAWGLADWPPLGRRTVVAVCEAPEGDRLGAEPERMAAPEVVQRVVWPVARALRELAAIGIAHRAIRPENLYWADSRRSSVILGECFSTPPGFDQSAPYETPANGAAHPAGREEGSTADDIYALGVTVLALTQQARAWRDMPPRLLIQRKLEFGSASALIGNEPPPPELMPMLRGVLNDDEELRWGLDDLEAWLRQERIPHHAGGGASVSTKALRIGRDQFRTRGAAAAGIAADVRAGAAAIRSGIVGEWLRSAVRDPAAATSVDSVARAAQRFSGRAHDVDDVMTARVGMLLDPLGPLRYRGVTVMPKAFGTLLATMLAERHPSEDLFGSLRSGLLHQSHGGHWASGTTRRGAALQFAMRSGLGAGLERCAYELNAQLPCLSPAILPAFATDLPGFLQQLEAVARIADFRESPLDQHGAGFLAHRLGFGAHRLAGLAAHPSRSGQRPMMELRLLAAAQAAAGRPRLPLLTNWMAHRTVATLDEIRNRPMRKRMSAMLATARESGQLGALLAPLDTARIWEEDRQGFERARILYRRAGAEILRLRADATPRMRRAAERGREIAAALSALSAFAIISLVLAMREF